MSSNRTYADLASTGSARLGAPPVSFSDYWMVRYIMLMHGFWALHGDQPAMNPMNGIPSLPGPPPGYHYQSNVGKQVVAGSVLTGIAIVMTLTRLALRIFHRRLQFGLDDILIIPACSLTVTNNMLMVADALKGGNGKHSWDTTYDDYKFNCQINTTCQVTMWLCLGFSKLSIAAFLRRITGKSRKGWQIFNYCFMAAVILWMIIITFVTFFECGNPRWLNDPIWAAHHNKPPVCMTINNVTLGASIVHVLLDFVLLGSAIFLFSKLQMSKTKKLRMYALFSTALFSCSTSILRNYYESKLGQDVTWDWYPFVIWIFADNNSALFVANLPVFNILFFRRDKDGNKSSSSRSHSSFASWPRKIAVITHLHKPKDSAQSTRVGGRDDLPYNISMPSALQHRTDSGELVDEAMSSLSKTPTMNEERPYSGKDSERGRERSNSPRAW